MTTRQDVNTVAAPASVPHHVPDVRPGILAAAAVLCVYGGMAIGVDFARAAYGFQSDEATYYMMGHSLAEDGDLTYRREDLVRVWHEFPGGPSGLFLKRGRDVQGVQALGAPPFISLRSVPDPATDRFYYGKSFAYPLFASPFVKALGTNGFLALHAILLALVTLAGYLFLNARSRAAPSVILATGFVLASVAPAYFVWITPELFNFALVTLGYFCWLYKEVAVPEAVPTGGRWLLRPSSDVAAAALLAIATFSKPSNALLIVPMAVWLIGQRRWKSAAAAIVLFGLMVLALFALNIGITGDWNFQGGERRTFNGGYPFQTPAAGFEVGLDRATNEVLTDVIFGPDFWTVFLHNLGYFFVGRYSGIVAYFFPAVFALLAFSVARRSRARWQWLVLAVALVEILVVIVWIPYNYFGGGGVLGNRYFMNTYGVFLFLLPPIDAIAVSLLPWIVGCLFTAQITLNPYYSSFNPSQHAKHGPLRMLPVELSLFNDLPVMTEHARVRLPFGTNLRFQLTFLDNNAYIETNAFWVRGTSRAETLVRYNAPAGRFALAVSAGAVPTRVTVRMSGYTWTRDIPAGETRRVSITLDKGFPYQGSRIWPLTISCSNGFVPMFGPSESTDNRYLGVRVVPELYVE